MSEAIHSPIVNSAVEEPTLSLPKRVFAVAVAVAVAAASRYPKASALGLSIHLKVWGFSPWSMLSCPSLNSCETAA